MIRRFVVVAGLLATSSTACAQSTDEPWTLQEALGNPEGLKVSASIRARYEALHDQFRPALDKNDDLVTIRTDIAAEYDTGPVRIGAELVDSRAYFGDPGSSIGTGEVNALEPIQAYLGADLGPVLGKGTTSTLDAGRFVLDLGSERLVARNNFPNTTTAFTGAKFDWHGAGKERLVLFYTYPQQRLPDDKPSILRNKVKWDHEGDDLVFWGGFFNKPKIAGATSLDLYFYALDENDWTGHPTRDRHLFTPGARLFREPATGKVDYQLEYAYQFGHISTGTTAGAPRQDVSAQTLHAELGYQFGSGWQPRLAVFYDFASGDRPGGKYGRFDGLFGTRRADWGPGGIYGPLGRSNISSPGIRLEVKPSKRWDGFVAYRAIWLDSASDSFASTGVRDASGKSGNFAGHQVEARARYWLIPKMLRFETGGAVLFDGRFLSTASNANGFGNTTYGYADFTLTI
ncbi:MAG: alginate export family protein [Croceibacterium sp.]